MSAGCSGLPRGLGSKRFWLICSLILAGVSVRLPFLNSVTPDAHEYVLPWFDRLALAGYRALGEDIPSGLGGVSGNYTPPYYYLLYVASLFDGVAPRIWLIKFISVAFDFLASFFAFKIVNLHHSEKRALIAAAAVLCAPTVVVNSAWWGQCDMIWASLLLGSFYFTMIGCFLASVILFGTALSFKAPAIFFAPFFLMLFLVGDLRVSRLACIPVTFAAMMLPATLLGRSWPDVLTTYIRQGGHFHALSMNAPNIYYFLSNRYYTVVTGLGLVVTTLVNAVLAYIPRHARLPPKPEAKVIAAAMFMALSPFLLPKMHDRYFFAADVFSIILAAYMPRLWLIPAIFQISSMSAYAPTIIFTLTGDTRSGTLPMAATLNIAVVAFLVYAYWRVCTQKDTFLDTAHKWLATASAAIVGAHVLWLSAAFASRLLATRLCPTSNPLGQIACAGYMPANLGYGNRWHWLLFFLFFAAPALALAHIAISRLWNRRRTGPNGHSATRT